MKRIQYLFTIKIDVFTKENEGWEKVRIVYIMLFSQCLGIHFLRAYLYFKERELNFKPQYNTMIMKLKIS